ncbi:hypothetical protein K505DRAFT_421411 [Melanomma pulvis-pyrius CBS 109.77]|uniref:BTB domain-containing protein n=1 Tax=Melanomma pulvis-pyrius CBS 109.77 TaxID=1314802 RepID=A0A6A6WVT8_9PLEO|nr:hypothetical protein K505DRAFT_421411 [Melanomma pulvis-pyrius CBS 109.77]
MSRPNGAGSSKSATFLTMGQDLVELNVGENGTPFMVHKDLLCSQSEYFRRAFNGRFQESEDGFTHVTDVSENTFKIFQQWLYGQVARGATSVKTSFERLMVTDNPMRNGKDKNEAGNNGNAGHSYSVDSDDDNDDADGEQDEQVEEKSEADKRYHELIDCFLDLFIFADRYETRQLRNDIISAMRNYNSEIGYFPTLECVPKAFEHLPATSTFCQYLIRTYAWNWNPATDGKDEIDNVYPLLPHAFTLNVMLINCRRANSFKKKKYDDMLVAELIDLCNFHEHEDEAARNDCKASKEHDKVFLRNLLVSCMPVVEMPQDKPNT